MALSAVEALALAKKYTGDTAEEFGAVKGAPCEVSDIDNHDGTHTVTLTWTNSQGETRTDSFTVLDGEDGQQGPQGETGPQGPQGPAGPSGGPVPPGGTDGQVIVKDGDGTSWADMSGGSLTDDMSVAVTVGGIQAGKTYEAGTPIEDVLSDMLEPTLYPTLTAPSASLSASPATTLYEKGATANITFTITFNRGSINPAYGTSGYRSGAAESYQLNSGTSQLTNTFTETVSESNKSFTGTVNYAAGEQPKDSKGNDYSSPLSAGSVSTATRTYEFVDAIWSNDSDITTIAKEALVSKSAKVKAFSFPAATVANPEVFDVPASWTVATVEVLNTLSNQWETATSQFTVTDTTHNDAAGNSVNYKRYTCNLGMAMGARQVRFKWS